MRTVEELFELALEYRPDRTAIEAEFPLMKSATELSAVSDDRLLAEMTKRVFQAGFNWKVIESKWPGFEEAFEGFDPERWKFMSDDDLDQLISDARIVRNGIKIKSVQANAAMLCDLADEHGSAAKAIAQWPDDDYIGLLDFLKKRGSRLGGATAQYFLRFIGKDGWVTSRDVVRALIREGVVDREPTSKTAQKAVQAAFNDWKAESGLPFAHISRLLAFSVGPNL